MLSPANDNRWNHGDAAALRFMSETRRRFLGAFSWMNTLTAHDRELRLVYIDIHITVLRDIAEALPARAGQVQTLIGKLEAAKAGKRPGI